MKRKIKYWFQRRTRGWSDDECWNLDYQFIVWLNEHLKVYRKEASKTIDLEFHKYAYDDKEYTLLQLINKLIEITDEPINKGDNILKPNEYVALTEEMLQIFSLIYYQLWW